MLRYFYHPESDSFWTQDINDPAEPCEDGHVVELTKEQYEQRMLDNSEGALLQA